MATTWDVTVRGTAGNDDIGSTSTSLDQLIRAGDGNDVLRGGKGDDRLVGGQGSDIMSGGRGADQFYFKASDVIVGTTDTDRIVDLTFAEGDTIVLDDLGMGGLTSAAGLNAFDGGNDAVISSYAGLVALVNQGGATATNGNNNLLILTFDLGGGTTQVIRISNAYAGFEAAL